jgi:uncharacterized membrane protein (DUF373 family)
VILEDKLREKSSACLHVVEAVLYIVVGALLSLVAGALIVQVGAALWRSMMSKEAVLLVLDQLLLVLLLVELLHTVRISVRTQVLVVEPFLIVGLIASIRRVLVITMQVAKLTEQAQPQTAELAGAAFRNTMIELGLLGFLVLVFHLVEGKFGRDLRRTAKIGVINIAEAARTAGKNQRRIAERSDRARLFQRKRVFPVGRDRVPFE